MSHYMGINYTFSIWCLTVFLFSENCQPCPASGGLRVSDPQEILQEASTSSRTLRRPPDTVQRMSSTLTCAPQYETCYNIEHVSNHRPAVFSDNHADNDNNNDKDDEHTDSTITIDNTTCTTTIPCNKHYKTNNTRQQHTP